MTLLEIKVIKAKRRASARLKRNYHLARAYGYSSYESTELMNQSHKTIIFNAEKNGMTISERRK